MEEEKRARRALALARRRALSPEQRRARSAAVCRQLTVLPALREAKIILSYMATWDELDLAEFHAWALKEGKQLAFPVSGPNGRMEAYIPAGLEQMQPGRYGILSPVPEASVPVEPETLDAVILPCVAFDEQGNRLGHGAGYYDRYLLRCPRALRVLVAFEAQRLDAVAAEEHDQAADILVTETMLWDQQGRT